MSAGRRVALAAVIATAVVGGFLPHGVLFVAQNASRELAQAAEAPLVSAPNCVDATCGKGSPAAPAPTPVIALAGVLSGLALAGLAAARWRRHRAQSTPLPAGVPDPLFHPPQFS